MRRALVLAAVLAVSPQHVHRAIEIWSVDPIAIDIEWITIDASGKTAVTARRQTAVGPPAPLEFTHGHDRFVRFSYNGASPRTYSTAELLAAKKLHVPDVLPGGELLLLVSDMPVRPNVLLVHGSRTRTVPVEHVRHASLAGLPAGQYTIEPIYEGGLKGRTKTITIAATQTTTVAVLAEDLGAVRITADNYVCSAAAEVGINALVTPPTAGDTTKPPLRSRGWFSKQPRCDLLVAGLKPGHYEAFYRALGANAGAQAFEVVAQGISKAHVAGFPVRVHGRVTLNGKSAANTGLMFGFSPGSRQPNRVTQTRTDAAGYYSLALETPGVYQVSLAREWMGSRSKPRETTLVEGSNLYDVAHMGGTITVKLIGNDGKRPINIVMRGSNGSMASSTYAPAKGLSPVFDLMPFGEYTITVNAGQRPARDLTGAQTAVLSAGKPEVTLTFDVSKK